MLYTAAVTGIAQALFPQEANGSMISAAGKPGGSPVGSLLIGQPFSSPKYFWGRPSATSPMPDNASASSGSNLGPNNPAQVDAVKGRIAALKAADPGNAQPVPVDLVTASGSGVDPEISLAAAYYQATRVARARGLQTAVVRNLIDRYALRAWFGFLGEPRVNVLALNLELDEMAPASAGVSPPAR